ncbi:MAG: class I SAM-dependent methyltransferase [Myxococcaceae bacterium]|jgi:ubiquinone/menaquinone biosynthesis C-methylase UbiE|nr:class I SAM-dependent methyltransferase [Myxococcaceae bacterium]MCA3014117.1 class I SAM-dependent methyltransferase [Myxococcaceae bacterium]
MRGVEQIPWLYDALCTALEWTGLGRWRQWLVGGARGVTLEVGCGTGRNLPRYARDVTVIGLDPDADALRAARRRAPDVPLVRASAEALPFRPGAFDTVVSSLVFCSVPRPLVGLAEVRRVLRDEGRLRMLEHVRHEAAALGWLQDVLQPAWTALAGGCHPNRRTEAAVVAAGFTVLPDERRVEGTLRRFSAAKAPPPPPAREPSPSSARQP